MSAWSKFCAANIVRAAASAAGKAAVKSAKARAPCNSIGGAAAAAAAAAADRAAKATCHECPLGWFCGHGYQGLDTTCKRRTAKNRRVSRLGLEPGALRRQVLCLLSWRGGRSRHPSEVGPTGMDQFGMDGQTPRFWTVHARVRATHAQQGL